MQSQLQNTPIFRATFCLIIYLELVFLNKTEQICTVCSVMGSDAILQGENIFIKQLIDWLFDCLCHTRAMYLAQRSNFLFLTVSEMRDEESCESTLDNKALTSSLMRFFTGFGLGSLTGSGLGSPMGSGLGSLTGSGLCSLMGSGLGSRTGSGLGSRTGGSGLESLLSGLDSRDLRSGLESRRSTTGSGVGNLSGVGARTSTSSTSTLWETAVTASATSTSSFSIPFT